MWELESDDERSIAITEPRLARANEPPKFRQRPLAAMLALLLLAAAAHSTSAHCPDDSGCPSTANCTIQWYNQTIGAPL